jgi:hypothetical protein
VTENANVRRVKDVEVTEEEARRSNEAARACIADARRDNRDYTKDWASH